MEARISMKMFHRQDGPWASQVGHSRLGEHVRKGRNGELCTNMHTHTCYLKQHLNWGVYLKNDLWLLLENQCSGGPKPNYTRTKQLERSSTSSFTRGLCSLVSSNPTTSQSPRAEAVEADGGWSSCSPTAVLTGSHMTPRHPSQASKGTEIDVTVTWCQVLPAFLSPG